MGLLSLAFGVGLGTGKAVAGMARQGPVGRAFLGAGIGAAYNYANSGFDSSQLTLESVAKGAVLGAFAGGVLPSIAKAGAKFATNWKGFQRASELRNPIGPRLPNGGFSTFIGPMTRKDFDARSYMAQARKSPLGRAMTTTTIGAAKAARFAFEHPLVTMGAIGAGAYGVSQAGYKSPSLAGVKMKTSVNEQAAAAEQMTGGLGTMGTGMIAAGPQINTQMRQSLMDSTMGLVNGLHRGRHG